MAGFFIPPSLPTTHSQEVYVTTPLVVTDEGPGVDEVDLPRISERFFRGRKNGVAGTGLGLTIATIAAARLSAKISFHNRSDRSGFVATVRWSNDTSSSAPFAGV
jgi:two-component system sensor histidine kinase QseC